MSFHFSKDFLWGAASASYQVEGAAHEDGKGLSVWDIFCQRPEAIWGGHTGDVACDHYHRYREDVSLMQEIGLKAYRLSISWPRVIPGGTGDVNPKGIDFYDRLIDTLLEAQIVPFVTLFHWDYPYDLFCRGGWLNPYSSDWFADYVTVVVKALSDRVQNWFTLNEPTVFVELGHRIGNHAPGMKYSLKETLRIAHNTLLAHGKGVMAIRSGSKKPCQVGFAPVGSVLIPESGSQADIEAARLATFAVHSGDNIWNNTWFADPIFLKKYPEDGIKLYGSNVPEIGSEDMDIIGQPLDFYAFNNYTSHIIRAGEHGEPQLVPFPPGKPMTAMSWPVTPEGLYWGAKFFWERYQKPIYITENGMANIDWISQDGRVHDPQRIDYTERYLTALQKAADEGVPIKGYFHWSIMDNFEWAEGYKQRFGMIYVDYPTQKRVLKDSAYWYQSIIAGS
jgi:beta-glucosidase